MADYTKEMFVKDKFGDYITNEWDILAASSLFKEQFKGDEAEKEVILGYANALDCITDSLLKQNHPSGTIMTFKTNSLTIPFVFLARHTVELTLKYMCRLLRVDSQPTHRLMPLWNKIIENYEKYTTVHRSDLKDIDIFIRVLEELDCDGSRSRYSKGKSGTLYNDKPKFINVKIINYFIQSTFINFVKSFKINKVDK